MRQYISLNGTWTLVLDPEDKGIEKKWFEGYHLPEGIPVNVPSVWDLWVPDYDGVGWYFRTFEWNFKNPNYVWEIHFEAADYYAEVWLNGKYLGCHEGGYTPFDLEATSALVEGQNFLAVRIVDPHSPEGYKHFLPKQIPCAKEHGYFTFAGLWGDVFLVGKHICHIKDVFIQPDIYRKKVNVHIFPAQESIIQVAIRGTSHTTITKSGKISIPFDDCKLWSPDFPYLYYLDCTIIDNDLPLDISSVRFGMRDFTCKDKRFYLNNKPIFIKGVLHQPDYPLTLVCPQSEKQAKDELLLAKEAGFNLIRLHIKTAPKLTLDICDEIGLLVYEEPPIGWIQKSPYMRERCKREVREMILRDRNHPSVVIWGILNESGNAGYVVNGGAQLIKDELCQLARELDPTRIIIDDSGGMNATRESSRMMLNYKKKLVPYEDLHIYQRAPVDNEIEEYYRHIGDPNLLYFLSEFGFGGIEDLEDVIVQYGDYKDKAKDARFFHQKLESMLVGYRKRELEHVFGDFSSFTAACREVQCDAIKFQIDACRTNSKLAGYCYTQLCDAGHEIGAGILDHWRRPKPAFNAIKEAQKPIRLIIITNQTNLIPRQETPLSILFVSDIKVDGPCDLSLQVVGPTGQVLWKKRKTLKQLRNNQKIWTGKIGASGNTGVHTFSVSLYKGKKLLTKDTREFFVVEPPLVFDSPVHLIDPYQEWEKSCASLITKIQEHAPVFVLPPISNSIRAYPPEEIAGMLADVYEGAVALIFEPPSDWNDFAEACCSELKATSKDAVGAFLGMYHYVKAHPIFEGLPMRCLMRQPYKNVVPAMTFIEDSDEDICGTFDTTPMAPGHYMLEEASWWGSDILVKRYGSGRVVFSHLRVFQSLQNDPLAARLFTNMLRHFYRRAVPSEKRAIPSQTILEWLKKEQKENIRKWMVCGMFPNWGETGHDTSYPPEENIDFSAQYTGWYKTIQWKRWYSLAKNNHHINLQHAFTPVYEYYPRFDRGVGYAYTEFSALEKFTSILQMEIQDSTKVWLNGKLILNEICHLPHKELKIIQKQVILRKGRNTVLVKISKVPGEFQFRLNFLNMDGNPLELLWWK